MQTTITYRLGSDPTIRKHTIKGEVSLGTLNTEFFEMVGLDLDMVYIQSWKCEEVDAIPPFNVPDIVKQFKSELVRSSDLEKFATADTNSRIISPDEVWAVIFTRKAQGFQVTCHHKGRPGLCYFWNNEEGWVRYEI